MQFIGNYLVPNSNLIVHAEHIKVDPGVSICLGDVADPCNLAPTSNGDLTFDAVDKDNGLNILGITTTIPVIGTDGLVDIGADEGAWDATKDYSQGDFVLGPDDIQYLATTAISANSTPPAGDARWQAKGPTILNGRKVTLTAFAGRSRGTATAGQTLSVGAIPTLASVTGFARTRDGPGRRRSLYLRHVHVLEQRHHRRASSETLGAAAPRDDRRSGLVRTTSSRTAARPGSHMLASTSNTTRTSNVHGNTQITRDSRRHARQHVDVTPAARPPPARRLTGCIRRWSFYNKGDVVTDTDGKQSRYLRRRHERHAPASEG